MFATLITRCILVASCLIQSTYADVCYLRSHRGYGGCIKWFLQAEEASNCTLIKLGGYAATFYKRSQIIEFDQPFVSDNVEEIQYFLEHRRIRMKPNTEISTNTADAESFSRPSLKIDAQPHKAVIVGSDMTGSASSTLTSVQPSTTGTQQFQSTTVTDTTQDSVFDYSTSKAQSLQEQSANELAPTEPHIDCHPNMSIRRLNCTSSTTISCNDNPRYCSKHEVDDEIVEILICGCNSTNTSSFIPMGFSHVNGTRKCLCTENGVTQCNNDGHMNGDDTCPSEVELESGECQIGNDGYQNISKFPRSKPADCHDLFEDGIRINGIYCVYPDYLSSNLEPHLKVYCNMWDWPPGGWTVIQRRVDGSDDFNRNWNEYKNGFGELNTEFWLGNNHIYHLTNQKNMQLRIDITNEGMPSYAVYKLFRIGNESTGYKLLELGDLRPGTSAHGLFPAYQDTPFSTHDRDMKMNGSANCANITHGGWWFKDCHTCNLNAVYEESNVTGILRHKLKGCGYNIMKTEMKILLAYD